MYKLFSYTHIGNIELLLDEPFDRIERQATAAEYYHLVLDVVVYALNLREKVHHKYLGDLVHYAFTELTENATLISLLFEYSVELFLKIHCHFTRLGLETFVHYRLVGSRSRRLCSYDYIKIDFEATAAWMRIRSWNTIQGIAPSRAEGVGHVVCDTPTQEQLETIYDAQNIPIPIQRNHH